MTDGSRKLSDAVLVAPIYPIIDIDLCRLRGLDPATLVSSCLVGGARMLQIRTKSAGGSSFLSICRGAVAAAAQFGALVIVNDRADVAAMAGAAGVHVGQTDLPPETAQSIAGPDAIVGLSTHTTSQVDDGLRGPARYVAVGPIFRTATKDTGYEPRGLDLVRYAAGRGKPIVAIGGISIDNAQSVIDAGASAVAVISDLIGESGPEGRVREYLARISARPFNV